MNGALGVLASLTPGDPSEVAVLRTVAGTFWHKARVRFLAGDESAAAKTVPQATQILIDLKSKDRTQNPNIADQIEDQMATLEGLRIIKLSNASPSTPLRVRQEVLTLHALRSANEGRFAQVDEAALALQNLGRRDPENLYQLSKCYARCFRLVTKGRMNEPLPSDTERVRKRYADAATQALSQAVHNGFSNFARLFRDPDMDIIRQEPGYRALVESASPLSLRQRAVHDRP